MKTKIVEQLEKEGFNHKQAAGLEKVLESVFDEAKKELQKDREKENKNILKEFLKALKDIDLAKKSDLEIQKLELQKEIQEVKGDLQKEIINLRGDLKADLIRWYIGGIVALGAFFFAVFKHFLN